MYVKSMGFVWLTQFGVLALPFKFRIMSLWLSFLGCKMVIIINRENELTDIFFYVYLLHHFPFVLFSFKLVVAVV